uniref:Nucleolar and coiled-body phosphoprotein 1-like n=1 Tax=Saccoglossus kowalevskii TaxID=10224 RepID=A0ABM0LUF8_SACKO
MESSDSSSSDSSSDSSSEEDNQVKSTPKMKIVNKNNIVSNHLIKKDKTKPSPAKRKKEKSSSSSESDSSSSQSDEEEELKTPVVNGKKKSKKDMKTPPAKSDKIVTKTPSTVPQTKKKQKEKSTTPFKRVDENNVEVDYRLADNSFEAKKGAFGSWGEKANKDLKNTRGKSFRHEKTKKKRGSYRGGSISQT